MKKEYDFTDAEQGKFYRPLEELQIPIYLEKDIQKTLMKKIKDKTGALSLNSMVNALIKHDIEISQKIS